MEDARRSIERWFASRGVPQLIEGYSSEQRMDARAVPLIAAWIVVGTVLIWAQPSDATLAESVIARAIAVVGSLLVLGAWLWFRGRPPFRQNARLDLLDIAIIGLVPGAFAALIHREPFSIIGVGSFVLLGVGIIYLVTGFGLIEIAGWALGYLRAQLGQIANLVARTLPVLLILVVFLLFASELWQAAHTLGGWDLVAVIGLLLAVASVLVVSRARSEVAAIEDARDWERIGELVVGTPAEPLRPPAGAAAPMPRRLWKRERWNLVVLMLVAQLVQSLFVALLVLVFLVLFGLLAIPESVQELWVGDPVGTVLAFELFDEPRLLSVELLVTAGLLGGVCALYFTGLALTDAAFRAEFHARVVGDVEQIMAVHTTYVAASEAQREIGGRGTSGAERVAADHGG